MDALLELRQRLRADPSLPPGTKLTFLPLFIKASTGSSLLAGSPV
jgi:pyruvate/2-oxoglutarate dehydrogenase complex dihydrolipoamide acyltransferase (E2) component